MKMKVTILENWESEHLEKLQKKFEAQGLQMVVSQDGRNAVVEGVQWASLEEICGKVKRSNCLDFENMKKLLPEGEWENDRNKWLYIQVFTN
ncbi:MAG: hypothetical protein HXS54_01460 [Theionarchaea archaeon]|nr:hypothetical protein [Theionarchaea archaeon]